MSVPHATVIDSLLAHADCRGERRFLTFVEHDVSWTFAEALAQARRGAAAIAAAGTQVGDRVLIVGGNEPAVAALVLGAIGSGRIPAVIHPPLRAGAAAVCALVERCRACAKPSLVVAPVGLGVSRLDAASCLEGAAEGGELVPPSPHAVCYLQFSSGTTGPQKAVAVTAGGQAHNCAAILEAIDASPDESWLIWLPYYHDMGLMSGLLIPLYGGQHCVLLSPESFVTRPLSWLQAIDEHRVQFTVAPNFAFALVARRAGRERLAGLDLSCLRVMFNGAEMVHADTVAEFARGVAGVGLPENVVYPVYGLAEFTLAAAFPRVGAPVRVDHVSRVGLSRGTAEQAPAGEPGSVALVAVGRALRGHAVRVARDGRVVSERQVGEIQLRGPSRMAGYWGDPERTREVTAEDGWLCTGDLGYVADGDLFVCGRIKDLIIRFGENYHPADLEQVAAGAPGVRPGRLAVLGIEDAALATERVWLVVETEATGDAACDVARDVRDHVLHAAGFKLDGVTCVRTGFIDKTSSGKVQRQAVRAKLTHATLGRWPVAE